MVPLISVIIPIYQAETFLHRAIDSVLNQTYGNIELILVDDGSTDDSGRMCDEYATYHDSIKVIHQTNQGVCAARNAGMDVAKGEYLIFLDSDDALELDATKRLLQEALCAKADIAIGQKTIVNSDGSIRTHHFPESQYIWSGVEFLQVFLMDHPAVYSACGKLYRTQFIKDIRFPVGRQINEDSFFVFECATRKPQVVVRDYCVMRVYTTRNSASRGAFSEKYFDILYFAEQKKRLIEMQYPELIDKVPNMMVKAHMAMLRMLSNQFENRYRQAERESIKIICLYRKYFVPAIQEDMIWFWIITHYLYPVYKCFRFLKNKLKQLSKH